MEILGIGPSELIFIVIIALIVLGPKDMQKAGKTIGQYLNKLVRSDGWKAFQQTSRELRNLPTNLMREANMDLAETEKEIRKSMQMPPTPGTPFNPTPRQALPRGTDNSILPPSATKPNVEAETSDNSDDKVNPSDENA